jgi:hypothetical protein
MKRLQVIAGGALALVLAVPVAAQEPAARPPSTIVTMQEAGQALEGMSAVYAELRLALVRRDSIYQALVDKLLALSAPTMDTPREELAAAVRTARAEAARAQNEVGQLQPQVATHDARYQELAGIAKARYEAVLNQMGPR